ncbi:MAG: formylglycine-generating enzyme family protein [Thermoguttaceae bacterium]
MIDDVRIYNRCFRDIEVKLLFESGIQALTRFAPEQRTPEQQLLLAGFYRPLDEPLKRLTGQLAAAQECLQDLERNWLPGWYVNGQGQTYVILNADKPFRMGSSDRKPNRVKVEVPHQQRIGRRFAIASKIVTKAQFRRFQQANPDVLKFDVDVEKYVLTDDSPQVLVDWYDAARYCNWLSETERIPKEQWCYEPNDQGKYAEGMKPAPDYLQRCGYRLPTEAEWEYACRSGTQTSRYYGQSDTLLPKYAWFLDNSQQRGWPVGMKKPNDYGLFDMLGNVFEWCDNLYEDYAVAEDGRVLDDPGIPSVVENQSVRVLRGGCFGSLASNVYSACRARGVPTSRFSNAGFRPARTYN